MTIDAWQEMMVQRVLEVGKSVNWAKDNWHRTVKESATTDVARCAQALGYYEGLKAAQETLWGRSGEVDFSKSSHGPLPAPFTNGVDGGN